MGPRWPVFGTKVSDALAAVQSLRQEETEDSLFQIRRVRLWTSASERTNPRFMRSSFRYSERGQERRDEEYGAEVKGITLLHVLEVQRFAGARGVHLFRTAELVLRETVAAMVHTMKHGTGYRLTRARTGSRSSQTERARGMQAEDVCCQIPHAEWKSRLGT